MQTYAGELMRTYSEELFRRGQETGREEGRRQGKVDGMVLLAGRIIQAKYGPASLTVARRRQLESASEDRLAQLREAIDSLNDKKSLDAWLKTSSTRG